MAWSVEATIGPLLIFVYIAFTLFGIYIAQFYYYYTTYRNDKRYLRLYVWAMGVLETTHTIFCIIFLYWYLVANFGDADNGVDRIHWALRASVMLEIVMVLMAQALYCWRIVQTSSGVVRVVATAIPGFLSFARFCLGLASFILWVPVDRWDVMLDDPGDKRVRLFHGTLTATFAVELATDAAISVLLSWCLWNKGRHTVFSAHTNDTVQKVVHIIMHTATANIISTIAVIITFNIMSGTPVFVAIVEMRSKLYANVMMSLLNARKIPVERKRELSPLKWARPPTMHVHIYADNDLRDARNTRGRQTLEDIKEESVTGKNPMLQ